LRLDEAGGLGVDRVLLRGSGKKLSDPIPALYTKPVFEEVARKDSSAMLLEFQKEYWVLGDEGALQRLGSSSEVVAEVLRIYEDDYIKFWKGTLGDLKLAPTGSREQLLESLRILSSDSSPLKGVLKLIAKNTFFGDGVGPDATDQALDKLGAAAGKAATASTGRLGSLFGAQAPAAAAGGGPKPGKRISESFAELQQLVGGDGPVPLDATLKLLADMYAELEGTGAGLGQQSAVAALSQGGGSPKARQLRDEAARLPPPLGEMFAQLGGGGSAVAMTGARSELAAAYREMVLTDCRQVVKGRYPFDRNATQEVPMADFARFFGAGGTLDSFFKQQLAPLVDTTQARWRWRSRDGASVALPQSLLDHFQQGARLRESFFAGGGAQPSVRFTLVPDFLDANYTRVLLEVDGEQLDYRHGPVRTLNVTWPKADFGRVTASLEGPDGSKQVLSAEGPWALFRALDRAQLKAEGGTRYTFELGGGAARIRLEASSLRNPFDMRLVQDFRCVEGL
jgi:type VI secretion system protein ImpL